MKNILFFTTAIFLLLWSGCDNHSSKKSSNGLFKKGDHIIKNAVFDADGNSYDAVQLGDQLWMKENLIFVGNLKNVESIPEEDRYNEPWYYVNEEADNLWYNSYAVEENGTKLCPEGWRIPTKKDWNDLKRYLLTKKEYKCGNSDTYIAKSLSDSLYWKCYLRPNEEDSCDIAYNPMTTNNATGFSARGYGRCLLYCRDYNSIVKISDRGEFTGFWCKDQNEYGNTICILFNLNSPILETSSANKYDGYSIRCIKDESSSQN